MVGALVTADRALSSASGEAAAVDALESSELFEQIVAQQIEAMKAFRGPLALPSDRSPQLERLAKSYIGSSPGLRDLTILDSAGRVLYGARPTSSASISRREATLAPGADG